MNLPVGDNDQSSSGVNITVASCHRLSVALLLSGDVGLGLVTRHIVAEGVRHRRPIAAIITGHHPPPPGGHWPGHGGHAAPGGGVTASVEHVQQVPAALCLPAATVILNIIESV